MHYIERLDKPIAAGKKQLRFNDDRAWLSDANDPIEPKKDGFIMAFDFAKAYRGLQRIYRHQSSFSLRTMAMSAGIAPTRVESWLRAGIFSETAGNGRGKIRKFPFEDLVAVFTLAALRRRGVGIDSCRAVARLIRGDHAEAPSRTAQSEVGLPQLNGHDD